MSLADKGLAEKEGVNIVLVVLGGTGILFHLVWFTSHGRLICANINTFEKKAISRDSHALFNLDDITDNKVRDGDGLSHTLGTSETGNIVNSGLGDEFLELLFLGVVVTGSDTDDNNDGTIDGDTVDPTMTRVLVSTDGSIDGT